MFKKIWIGSILLCLLMPLTGSATTYTINTSGDWITQLTNAGVPNPNDLRDDTIIVNAGVTLFMNNENPEFFGVFQFVNNGTIDASTSNEDVFDIFDQSEFINNNLIKGNISLTAATGTIDIYDDARAINNGTFEDISQIQLFGRSMLINNGIIRNIFEKIEIFNTSTLTNFGSIASNNVEIYRNATLTNAGQMDYESFVVDQNAESVGIFSCNPPITAEADNVTIEIGGVPATFGPVPAGLACTDGDRDTQGETWDGDCNCVGGVEVPVFSQGRIFLFALLMMCFTVFFVYTNRGRL